MRHRRFTTACMILALALTSLSFKCGGDGAPPEPARNAARASDAIAKSIGEMIKVKRQLAQQGKITAAEELALTQTLLRVNTADKALVNRLKSLNSAPDAATKADLVRMFGEVTTALNELNTTGLLGVRDEDARNRLTTIFNTITASVQIIRTFIDSSNA